MAGARISNEVLAEIYRRGMKTANAIVGDPIDRRLVYRDKGIKPTLDYYRLKRPDDYLYEEFVMIPFFAGMKAKIVEAYRKRIMHWFPDFHTVARYSEREVQAMLADSQMFHHEPKIRATIANAQELERLIDSKGSVIEYVFSFAPHDSYANLDTLVADFAKRFSWYGPATSMHFLMEYDIGLPLIKPDLHMMRIFYRIGLVERDKDESATIGAARKMAAAAGVPVTWVDRFVTIGMGDPRVKRNSEGVCAKKPRCDPDMKLCKIGDLCQEWRRLHPNETIS